MPVIHDAQPALVKKKYSFPPGLPHNLVWYSGTKFRPGDAIALFQYLKKEYGDIAHYKLGRSHIIFLDNPEYIREVLVVQNDNFVKERTVQRTKMLLGEGMITAEGVAHKTQRQAAQPAFHRQRVAGYAETMVAEAVRARESWRDGQHVDISKEMMSLTLRIIARTLFNTELGAEVKELSNAINTIMNLYHYLIALPAIETLVHLRVPPVGGFSNAKEKIDGIVYSMIAEHEGKAAGSGDLLDMMLRARERSAGADLAGKRDELLRDEVITIFLAGYETVASALTWTWYLLSQNPEAEQKMQQEVDDVLGRRMPTADDVSKLKYVEMVLAEAMRLYPPAWAMGRLALADFELGPYRLPAGTTVLISQFITQRDERNFDDPLRFNPERFAPAGRATFPKFSYFPFGAGFRQCIGEALAWTEGILVLATVAQKWQFRLQKRARVAPQQLITLRPKYGMAMHAIERRCS
jgi:cytochrome P450